MGERVHCATCYYPRGSHGIITGRCPDGTGYFKPSPRMTPETPCSRPSCKRNRERLEVLEAEIRNLGELVWDLRQQIARLEGKP